MPGAADCVADDKAIADWTAVVRTLGADCEKIVAASNEDHRLTTDMTGHHGAVRYRG